MTELASRRSRQSQAHESVGSLYDGFGFARRLTMQMSCRNADRNNQEEFKQMTMASLGPNGLQATKQLGITSNVSLTESKLIIALKKQLVDARNLLEHERLVKLKLIEGARDLKRQLTEALKEQQRRPRM